MAVRDLSLGITPRAWQARVHRERKRFSVLVLHRRAGKTVFAVLELLLCAVGKPDGRYAYIAPFYAQAKAVAWDLLKKYARAVPGITIRESELKIEFKNGATIRLYGADNADALRGLGFDGVVVDEVADIEPGVWGEVIRPALADRLGWAIFIGTAKGINLFSELYYRAERDPEWYALQLTVEDTGALPRDEIEAARREMTEAQFAAEMMCVFSAGGVDILIPAGRVEEASRRGHPESAYLGCGIALGVDPARFGDDSTALILRRGPVAYGLERHHGLDTMEVADLTAQRAEESGVESVFVDEGGLGAGVVDRLRQLGHTPIAVNFGTRSPVAKYANTRTRLWGELAEWLRHGSIPNDLRLKNDLSAPTFKFDAQQRMVLESKSDMKRRGLPSPDCGDALALTFYAPVPARDADGGLLRARFDRRVVAGAEYDPFALDSE